MEKQKRGGKVRGGREGAKEGMRDRRKEQWKGERAKVAGRGNRGR